MESIKLNAHISISAMQEEASRLLEQTIKLYTEMLNEEDLLQSGKDAASSLSKESVAKEIEILKGEQEKIKRMETVIAIVGTMKAGKSTTINAIVGAEVMPNRNRPMTAIPTLVRHTKGQLEPRLVLSHQEPINQLMLNIKTCLAENAPENQESINSISKNEDMVSLLKMIDDGSKFQSKYTGADAIFECLSGLNDLVRLSAQLDLPFPFEAYRQIENLPVIEIEFIHLKDAKESEGTLTLLDTPGPNEAGHVEHLEAMLKDQLSKASAVLAVFDYTQLKSDADAKVRAFLQEVATTHEGRMYALVNKFDQENSHSDSAEDTQTLVAEELMKNTIKPEAVFPVSSNSAFLANRARAHLAQEGSFAHLEKKGWLADFAKEAFGRGWKKDLDEASPEKINQKIADVWEDSRYDTAMEKVIKTAHANSAITSIASASSKLSNNDKLNNFLNLRTTAFNKSAEELDNEIKQLNKDIKVLLTLEKETESEIEKLLEKLECDMGSITSDATETLKKDAEKYFEDGCPIEKKQDEQKIIKQQKIIKRQKKTKENTAISNNSVLPNLSILMSNISNIINYKSDETKELSNDDNKDFYAENGVIKLTNKAKAEECLEKIQKSLDTIIYNSQYELSNKIDKTLLDFEMKFSDDLCKKIKPKIESICDRMNKQGFSIKLTMPPIENLSINKNTNEILSDMLEEKKESRKGSRRQSGLWGGICNLFSTEDWGWEDYSFQVDIFELDTHKINNAMNESLKHVFSDLNNQIIKKVQTPLTSNAQEFYAEISDKLSGMMGDLEQGLKTKNTEKASKEQELKLLKSSFDVLKGDIEGLASDVHQHSNNKVAA